MAQNFQGIIIIFAVFMVWEETTNFNHEKLKANGYSAQCKGRAFTKLNLQQITKKLPLDIFAPYGTHALDQYLYVTPIPLCYKTTVYIPIPLCYIPIPLCYIPLPPYLMLHTLYCHTT